MEEWIPESCSPCVGGMRGAETMVHILATVILYLMLRFVTFLHSCCLLAPYFQYHVSRSDHDPRSLTDLSIYSTHGWP